MPSLRITLPQNKGEMTHVLSGDRITIGRRPDNMIQIIERSVSGYHAELLLTGDHYRLHDLGATNLTFVDGKPIDDCQLQGSCKVAFGSIECEYIHDSDMPTLAPTDAPAGAAGAAAGAAAAGQELAPAPRSEVEFWTRENQDLQCKIALLQKQIDILGSARLMTKETTQLGVSPEAHRRLASQRDALLAENEELKDEAETLKCDLMTIMRERDALRQAWETVKGELAAAQQELAVLKGTGTEVPTEASVGA